MDATNNKTLSGFLVTLLLGAVFLGAVTPTAEATHLNTGGADVQIDVRTTTNPTQTVTIKNGTDIVFTDIFVPTSPSGFKMRHSTAYELTFIGIDVGTSSGYGYANTCGATGDPCSQVEIVNASSGVVAVTAQPLTTGPDGSGGVLRNATLFVQTTSFQGPGLYYLRTVEASPKTIANIVVWPHDDITVSMTTNPTPLVWSQGQNVVNIGTGVSGAVISSNAPGFIVGNPSTDANGNHVFITTLPQGVGTWTVYAGKTNHNGAQCMNDYSNTATGATGSTCPSIPERMGNATLAVTPNALTVTGTSTAAFVGFQNTVIYNLTYASTGNAVIRSSPTEATVTHWNFSARDPNGFLMFVNETGAVPTTFSGTWMCQTSTMATAGTAPGPCASDFDTSVSGAQTVTVPTVVFSAANHRLSFTNGTTWVSGSYAFAFQLEADTTAGFGSAPEFVGSWTLAPATPSAVTLSADQTTLNVPAPVPNPITALSPVSATIGTVDLLVTVSGSTIAEHPFCRLRVGFTSTAPAPPAGACDPYGNSSSTNLATTTGAEQNDGSPTGCVTTVTIDVATAPNCFVDNITVRGNVLPGWKVRGYNPDTGVATLRLTPSANGTIYIDVAWKNTTTTLAIPVINGANVTLDKTNMTVDLTTDLTATVKDAFGNAQSAANVYLFRRIVDSTTGAASGGTFTGTGPTFVSGGAASNAGGNYLFDDIKPTAVQDLVVLAQVGSGTNVNWSYVPVTVLPSQTLVTTLSANNTMAGLRTPMTINVTNATGIGKTTTLANYKLFFLTPTQKRDLDANGTTAFFTKYPIASFPAQVIDTSTADRAWFNLTLTDENDYAVWFCSAETGITDCSTATHDNRANMPMFNVTRYTTTFSPTQIASSADIQSNSVITVSVWDRAGVPANGTLRIKSGTAGGNLVTSVAPSGANTTGGVAVTNGVVNLTLTGVGGVGDVNFEFDPTEATGTQTSTFATTKGNLSVVAGNLTFSPTKVPILQSTLVTVRLANFTGAGLAGRVIRLCSVSLNSNFPTTVPTTLSTTDQTNCPAVGTTEADGTTGIVVTPTSLTPIHVYINNSYTQRTISVTAGTLTVTVNPTAPSAGQNVTFTATQPGGTPSVGSRILVTKNGTSVFDSTADGNGQATMPGTSVTAGTYVVTAIRSGFDNGTATFTVGGGNVTPGATFELSNLVLPSTINVGSPITVSVDVENTGTASGTATAILLVNNAQRDTQSVTLGAGENTTVAYTFTPTVAGTYSVSVRIGTTTIGPQTITVGTVTPTTTPTGVTPTGVTPTGVTPTGVTPTGVTPTGVTPTSTATPTTPATTTPRVPGFEVVALIAALGVAMLVLRRRN